MKKTLVTASIVLALGMVAYASPVNTLADYNFAGATLSATTVDPNVSASDITLSPYRQATLAVGSTTCRLALLRTAIG